jgi:hypothetical protein
MLRLNTGGIWQDTPLWQVRTGCPAVGRLRVQRERGVSAVPLIDGQECPSYLIPHAKISLTTRACGFSTSTCSVPLRR